GELLTGSHEVDAIRVERRAGFGLDASELLAIRVGRQHGEHRLRIPQRHLFALERHARGEELVLELVLALGELRGDETGLAGLPQPVEELTVLTGRAFLGVPQRIELLPAEEIRKATD